MARSKRTIARSRPAASAGATVLGQIPVPVRTEKRAKRAATDVWLSHPAATRELYEHQPTTVSASGRAAHEVLPAVHTVFSLVKRWAMGTLQGSVSPEQGYFDEWVFRLDRRRSRGRGLLFHRLMAQAATGYAITYNDLRKAGRTRPVPVPGCSGAGTQIATRSAGYGPV